MRADRGSTSERRSHKNGVVVLLPQKTLPFTRLYCALAHKSNARLLENILEHGKEESQENERRRGVIGDE